MELRAFSQWMRFDPDLLLAASLVKRRTPGASANRLDRRHKTDETAPNVTASNLPENLSEDPLDIFSFFFSYLPGPTDPRKNSSSAGSSPPISPSAIGGRTPRRRHAHATSHLTQSRPDVGTAAQPHMETMSCSLELVSCLLHNL